MTQVSTAVHHITIIVPLTLHCQALVVIIMLYSTVDQQWNQQPQSSVNAPPQDNVQYELPHHPSYALPCK